MLKLDKGDEVPAKTTYMDDTDLLKTDEIDIDKIRVSNKYLCKKEYDLYKNYVFYEHIGEYIPLKIILMDVVGYYSKFENTENSENNENTKKEY